MTHYFRKLHNSLSKMVQVVLSVKGGHTKYWVLFEEVILFWQLCPYLLYFMFVSKIQIIGYIQPEITVNKVIYGGKLLVAQNLCKLLYSLSAANTLVFSVTQSSVNHSILVNQLICQFIYLGIDITLDMSTISSPFYNALWDLWRWEVTGP